MEVLQHFREYFYIFLKRIGGLGPLLLNVDLSDDLLVENGMQQK